MFQANYPATKLKIGPRKFEMDAADIDTVLATHPYSKPMVRRA